MKELDIKKITEALQNTFEAKSTVVSFRELKKGTNHKGVPISFPGNEKIDASVLLISERYNAYAGKPIAVCEKEAPRYIMCAMEVPLYRDAIVSCGKELTVRCDTVEDIVLKDNSGKNKIGYRIIPVDLIAKDGTVIGEVVTEKKEAKVDGDEETSGDGGDTKGKTTPSKKKPKKGSKGSETIDEEVHEEINEDGEIDEDAGKTDIEDEEGDE